MGDRESDLYDLFLAKRADQVDLLVRAAQNRRVEGEHQKVWATVEAAPVVDTLQVKVPKRGNQAARLATVSVRFSKITLLPPQHRSKEDLATVSLTAVLAQEEHPPAEVTPLEWLLLTTCQVTTSDLACQKIDWYACRWTIEVWHKVLKSGCQIEAKQLESRESLERCLALYSVIAWRILYASLLARSVPEAPCTETRQKGGRQAFQNKCLLCSNKQFAPHQRLSFLSETSSLDTNVEKPTLILRSAPSCELVTASVRLF